MRAIMILIFTFAVAAVASRADAQAASGVSASGPRPRSDLVAVDPITQAARAPRETALRKIGLPTFMFSKEFKASEVDAFMKKLIADLSLLSYFEAAPLPGLTARTPRTVLAQTATYAGYDGVIIGDIADDHVVGTILSRDGDVLGSFALSQDVYLDNESEIKKVSDAVIDEIARAIPYRGFVTRQVDDGYEINLGTKQGMQKGQHIRLFEFGTVSMKSERVDVGEVEIISVKDDTSVIIPVGSTLVVRLFSKVGFIENAHGMMQLKQIQTRGYAFLGGGLLNIAGSADPKYIDRAYKVSSTPAFILGGGWKKFSLEALIAQAKGDQSDLVYTEILANYAIYEHPFGLNRLSFAIGGRYAQVGVTTRANVVTNLVSTTSISPAGELRLDHIFKGPVHGFADLGAYFPIFVSGISSSALFFSYGIGSDVGLGFDVTPRIFMEVGARYHLIRRPVDGQSSVQETYGEYFGDVGYRF